VQSREVAVALPVAQVRVADGIAVGALRLQVLDGDRQPSAGRVQVERLRERRPVQRVVEERVDGRRQDLPWADRCHDRRFIESAT
jgi:hypothetical protein